MKNPVLNRAIFVLSLLGLLIAALLWSWHSHPQDIPCGPQSNGCRDVALSPYSRFPYGTGLPVAAYGTVGYFALALLAFLRTQPNAPTGDRTLLGLITLGAAFGTAAAGYLTYLEFFVIQAICKWCIASQVIIALIFILALVDWSRSAAKRRSTEQPT